MKIEHYIETNLLQSLKTKRIDDIRISAIIEETGICKGTFYKYYQDKYSLLIRSFENFYYNDILRDSDNWESFVLNALGAFKSNPAIIINAFDSSDVNSLRTYHEKLMLNYFFTGAVAERGEFYSYSAAVFVRCVTDTILDWLKNKCLDSEEVVLSRIKAIMPVTLSAALNV